MAVSNNLASPLWETHMPYVRSPRRDMQRKKIILCARDKNFFLHVPSRAPYIWDHTVLRNVVVTCYRTEVRIPHLLPAETGTRFSDPGGMQGWVNLRYVKADRFVNEPARKFEPATCQSQAQCPTAAPPCNTQWQKKFQKVQKGFEMLLFSIFIPYRYLNFWRFFQYFQECVSAPFSSLVFYIFYAVVYTRRMCYEKVLI